MARIDEDWFKFPFTDEALETVYALSYQHMIIMWVDLLSDYPDMTDEEINDYFAHEQEDIARRLSYRSWQEIDDEDWCFKREGAVWEVLEYWETHGRQ